jgi:hypothetical protein
MYLIIKNSITYNEIKKQVLCLKDKYNIKIFNYREYLAVTFLCFVLYLIKTTNLMILEIHTYLVDVLNYDIIDPPLLEFFQYMIYIICIDINIGEIKDRIINFDEIKERMNYRLELTINNWKQENIEKYIIKLYKLESNSEKYDNIIINGYYHNIFEVYFKAERNTIKHKGRPSLPTDLKIIQHNKHKEEIKQIMKNKYIKSIYFDTIYSSLLTSEELLKIKSCIVDPVIIEKLNILLKSNYEKIKI